jgi:cytosine/adenosine deaminase-related metal-dependent hydrolase
MRTLIQGGWVVGYDGRGHVLIPDGVVVFENDAIVHVGRRFGGAVDRTIDARGMLVGPGFVDTHVHFGHRALHRLFSDTGRPEFYGQPFLEVQIARQGRAVMAGEAIDRLSEMRREDRLALEAEYTVAELLRNGITTFVEFGGRLDVQRALLPQVARLGIRGYLAGSIESGNWAFDANGSLFFDWDVPRGLRELDEAVAFIEEIDGSHAGRIKGILVPNKVETCSEEVLDRAIAIAKANALPLAIHTAYNVHEFYYVVNRHRTTPIGFLGAKGYFELGPKLNLGHCNFLGDNALLGFSGSRDLELIGAHRCSVSHCPVNLVRRARFLDSWPRYREAGVNMTLGTDTYPRDMFAQMRAASYLGKLMSRNLFGATAGEVFTAATIGGADSLGRGDLGRLAPGAKADIVLVKLQHAFRSVPLRDPIKAIVECGVGDDVDTVIVDGEMRMGNGAIRGLDVAALFERTQRLADATWEALPDWDPLGRTAGEMGPFSFPLIDR